MKKDNIFWGVLLLLAAVYILAHSLGFTPDISLMRIVIGIICVMCFIKSAIRLEFGGMLFSLAILLIMFEHVLGIEALTPWPVLWKYRSEYDLWEPCQRVPQAQNTSACGNLQ